VAAAAEAAGHKVSFIHFKRFRMRAIPRQDKEHLEWAVAQSPYQVREVTSRGERFHPYPTPASDKEFRLFAELIEKLKPDVVGITFATHALRWAVKLTDVVHETRPGVPVVWGGVHAIIDPETCIEHADVVCPGEGEEAFVEYLADTSRTDIAGLWFKDGAGRAIRNPFRPLIQDLDRLPWPIYGGDEYQIDGDRIERRMAEDTAYIRCQFYTETMRGCPFACSYCIHSTCRERYTGQKYMRPRSLENVIEEIRRFRQRFGLQAVLPFFDEILLINKPRFARLADLYRREIGHPFCGFAHHKTTDREMLEIARDAGIAETSIGLQTGSEKLARDIYNRPIDREAIIALARDIHELGAGRLVVNVLCDCAFEREEDLRATFDVLLEMPRPYILQLSRVVPFPNTVLARLKCDVPPLKRNVREFWNQMYLLTQTDRLDNDTLRALAADPYLREHPEVLDPIVSAVLADEPAGQEAAAEEPPPRAEESTHPAPPSPVVNLYRKLKNRVATLIG